MSIVHIKPSFMKNNHNIAILSARFLAEEMSECEKAAFLNQLKNNRTMQDEFEKMKETWNNMDTVPSGKFNHTGKAWEELKNRLYSRQSAQRTSQPSPYPGMVYPPHCRRNRNPFHNLGWNLPTYSLTGRQFNTRPSATTLPVRYPAIC